MSSILLIDDEELFRTTLALALRQMGFAVTEATDGQQGIGLYIAGKFDVVITDLIMPGKEGMETIIELRKLDPTVKIIAISGGGRHTSVDYLQIAGKVGAKKTLTKPFSFTDLKAAVDEVLDSAKSP